MNIKITYNWLKEYLKTDATPQDLQKYLSLCGPGVERIEKIDNDFVFDIEITSNRIDSASVMGIAKEAEAILPQFGKKAEYVEKQDPEIPEPATELAIEIEDPEKLCNRLMGIVLDSTEVKESPVYIQSRLSAADIRPLNNLIDITNYIMRETGQPMHVFDYDRINTGKLIIRHAKDGETLKTLDGKTHKLVSDDVVIDDGTGRIIDLPGIMGTENSVVTEKTKRVLLFTENNNAHAIRKTSMRLGIRTDAATINDKGPDPELLPIAMKKSVALFTELAGAKVASRLIDVYHSPVIETKLEVYFEDIFGIMGVEIDSKTILSILTSLGFSPEQHTDKLVVTIPSSRLSDVSMKEDIVEEIARVYGYHNMPNTIQKTSYVRQPKELDLFYQKQTLIKNQLKHLGGVELMSYSMVSRKLLEAFELSGKDHIRLSNTISEEIEFMRRSLIPSHVQTIAENKGRRETMTFFEIAKIYTPQDNQLPIESYRLCVSTTGSFENLKGLLESVFAELHIREFKYQPSAHQLFQESLQAAIHFGAEEAGVIGLIKRSYAHALEVPFDIFVAELSIPALVAASHLLAPYSPPTPYAVIKLDYTFELSQTRSYADILKEAKKIGTFVKAEVIDLYKNKLTLRFYFGATDHNMTEQDAKADLESIVSTV